MTESSQAEEDTVCQTPVRSGRAGQAMVEYALILVLIAIAVIVIVTVVGHQVNNAFSNISHGLGS